MVKQKKTMKMKKIYIGVLTVLMVVTCLAVTSLAGCGPKVTYTYTIGAIQVAPHSALTDAYNGFKDELTRLMEEKGKTVGFELQNAAGEFSANRTIADGYVLKNVDLIYALGTPSAQAAKNATTTIPVLFNAVTDPMADTSKLVDSLDNPGGNVSGVSDEAPITQQLELLVRLLGDKSKVIGVVYNDQEPNSMIQADAVKAFCEEKGYTFEAQTVPGDMSNIKNCFDKLKAKGVTGIYMPTDNLMAENMGQIKQYNKDITKCPIVCAEIGMAKKGGVATLGLNYYNLGKLAGQMAFDVLYNKKSIGELPVIKQTKDFDKFISEENAATYGYTIPADILAEFKPAA